MLSLFTVAFQESTIMERGAKDILCVYNVPVDLEVSVARLHHVSGASEGESYHVMYRSLRGLDEGAT